METTSKHTGSALWTTKDGRKIPVNEMTDAHLANSIAMLERASTRKAAEALECYPSFGGEMAQYYAEAEWNATVGHGDDPSYWYPIYDDLVEEQARRVREGVSVAEKCVK